MKAEDVKVGQRVCYTGGHAFLEGCVGTCTYISSANQIAIEFDKSNTSLHTCNGHCKEGHGWWCRPLFLNPVEEETVKDSIPCAPPPVDVTAPDRETPNDREMSKDQVDVHIARLEDALKGLFTLGVSETEMHDLFNDACKGLFLEKRYRDRIAKIKDKVTKCQN